MQRGGLGTRLQVERIPRRGSLFRLCDPHTQRAIVELHEASKLIDLARADPNKKASLAAEIAARINESIDILLHSKVSSVATSSALNSSFQKTLQVVSAEMSGEVSSWLSATYSPHHPPSIGNLNPAERSSRSVVSNPQLSDEMKVLLDKLMNWDAFNIFTFHTATGGHSLSQIAYPLFQHFNLMDELHIDIHKFNAFWLRIESGYKDVPYHNSIHAADVMHGVGWFANSESLRGQLKPLEICAMLFAAGIHDHDHPAVNNDFLIKSKHDLALRYNDRSVLENHHASTGLSTLQKIDECNFLSHLSKESLRSFRQYVISMVLATDMSRHLQLQQDFAELFEVEEPHGPLTLDTTLKREVMFQEILHCADIGNCGKPFHLAEKWGDLVTTEFFDQGDQEKALGLRVSPMNNRETCVVEKSQMAFIQHVSKPMFESVAAVIPEAHIPLANAVENIQCWQARLQKTMLIELRNTVPRAPPFDPNPTDD
eukprot:c1980_g1_i1.p1 GENE.c1980_g1_i1~~c1980_g1_i1.p1  ORF type:complete len:485 (-),score=87.07 c1980_g1_i1:218-1672(-)